MYFLFRPRVSACGLIEGPTDSFRAYLLLTASNVQRQSHRRIFEQFHNNESQINTRQLPTDLSPITTAEVEAFLEALAPGIPLVQFDDTLDQSESSLDQEENVAHHNAIMNALSRRVRVMPLLAVIESSHAFFFIQESVRHTLRDIIVYSPDVLSDGQAKPLFVIYQVIKRLQGLHENGLVHGQLNSSRVLLESDLFVWLSDILSTVPIASTSPSENSLIINSLSMVVKNQDLSFKEAVTSWFVSS